MTPTPIDAVFAARVRGAARAHPTTPELSVVVPLFDEQDTLPELHRRLTASLGALGLRYELVFVDDGSRDATPGLLARLADADPHVVAVHLSRNFGHQSAVTAGLETARGRAVVVMDGDLQDPPELIGRFVDQWRAGAEVVFAVRATRREGPLKRFAYRGFYRVLRAVSDLDIPLDAGDFCLMDRKAVDALNRLPERSRFVRGLRAYVGFRQVGVRYDRDARHSGSSKYTLRKLVGLAASGLFGFSGFPVRAVAVLGTGLFALSGLATAGLVLDAMFHHGEVRGWAAVVAAVGAVGGLQLIATGIIGEYVRRVFGEVTGRPPYIVREVVRRS